MCIKNKFNMPIIYFKVEVSRTKIQYNKMSVISSILPYIFSNIHYYSYLSLNETVLFIVKATLSGPPEIPKVIII